MKPILETCKPRADVLRGDLEDASFAAYFGRVVANRAPRVYNDPAEFFRNTHPAQPLKKVVTTIFERLADPNEAGAAVRLSTGFGGGKTHALIALWHLARNIGDSSLGTDLLPAAGRPRRVTVAGIDAKGFGTTICAEHDGLMTHSLWGELAYQLGGKAGYAKMAPVDDPINVPHDAAVRAMLPADPVLILLDELVIYMAQLSEQAQGALLSFLSKLISEVGARHQAVLVLTDPAGQPAYDTEAQRLADATSQLAAAKRLDDVLGRATSDFDPIGSEAPQVILRRLFDSVDKAAAERASAEYYHAYQRVAAEYPELLPRDATTAEYAQRIVNCYPFHPRLLDTAQDRLAALQDFNKSRGTLRLFARIVRDVWDSGSELALVTGGDLDWQSGRIQADLLRRLNRDEFMPAVTADVVRHAGQLDALHNTDVHRRAATALLLESLPHTPAAAMDKPDITLAILRPSEVGDEPGKALDSLYGVCWHTYKVDTEGRRFQFRFDPNANKIIEERAQSIPLEDARQAVLTYAQAYFSGRTFKLVAWPATPKAVTESADLKLVLADSEPLAQRICDYEDDADPEALRPRRFRNAIFGIAPTPSALDDAVQHARRRLAAEQVFKEQRPRTPLRQQVEELLPTLRKRAQLRAIRAFNRVMFQGRPSVTLDERYLVSEESALATVADGQTNLKEFLDNNRLVYQPGDALDVGLLLDLMAGATPSLDHPGAFPASSVHERGLASPRLRLLINADPVRLAVLKALTQGRLVVRLASGTVYDSEGCVKGPDGNRVRESGTLAALKLEADVLLAPIDAPCVAGWTYIDEAPPSEDLLTPAEAAEQKGCTVTDVQYAMEAGLIGSVIHGGSRKVIMDDRLEQWQPGGRLEVTAYDWKMAMAYATARPLLSLRFKAATPAAADRLIACAQPFGAQALRLTVQAGGQLQDGAQFNFLVKDAKHNNPLKPIDLAKRLYGSAAGAASFSAILDLDFGGQAQGDQSDRFRQAQEKVPEGLTLEARFGPEGGHE